MQVEAHVYRKEFIIIVSLHHCFQVKGHNVGCEKRIAEESKRKQFYRRLLHNTQYHTLEIETPLSD